MPRRTGHSRQTRRHYPRGVVAGWLALAGFLAQILLPILHPPHPAQAGSGRGEVAAAAEFGAVGGASAAGQDGAHADRHTAACTLCQALAAAGQPCERTLPDAAVFAARDLRWVLAPVDGLAPASLCPGSPGSRGPPRA